MTMHQHDTDLIMALAEGALPEGEATRAEADIAGCEECSRDLSAQRVALSALRAAPAASMTQVERATVRGRLISDLNLVEEVEAVPSAAKVRRRSRIRWGALGTAATVLIALVLVAPAVHFLTAGGSSNDVTSATTTSQASRSEALAAPATTTTAAGAATTTAAAATTALAAPPGAAGDFDATDLTFFAESDDGAANVGALAGSGIPLSELRSAVESSDADAAISRAEVFGYSTRLATVDVPTVRTCSAVGRASFPDALEVFALATDTRDGTEVVIFVYVLTVDGDVVLLAQDAISCQIRDRTPEQ